MSKPVCAVTGSTGYVGSRIAQALSSHFELVPLARQGGPDAIVWSMQTTTGIADQLQARRVEVLVHTAWDFSHPSPKENWATNVEGSRRLLADAQQAGVRRIVFISTISAFDEARSEYGKSKLAVERLVTAAGGIVLRPGLVWGDRPGGMFGSLREQTAKGGIVPMIGDGAWPQYLVHEDDLAAAVVRAAATDDFRGRVLTVAHPNPWTLRALIETMAREQGKKVKLVALPWRLIYFGIKSAERLGLKLSFRSDSLLSLVYQNRSPAFAPEFPVRPFQGA